MNENDNVVFLDNPPVTEDSILINQDALHKLKFQTYEKNKVEFGSKQYPLDTFKANEVLLNLGKEFNDQFNNIFGKGKPDDNSSE